MNRKYINGTSSYEITPLTMAVIPHYNEQGNLISKVIEVDGERYVDIPPIKLIENSCKFFGANLRGRQIGTRYVTGVTHKAPISLDPSNGMYFFPTTSPISSKCCWIAHSYVLNVDKLKDNCSEILFNNGQKITFEVSYGSMCNQVHRTAQYRFLLSNRLAYQNSEVDGSRIAESFFKPLN